MMTDKKAVVIGGGLAGVEAANQLAKRGIKVTLYEMKPKKYSPAHSSEKFCELVCSNSLKADRIENACGLLKEEMRKICDEGGAIFFSTHVLDVAEKICDNIAIIKDGRLVISGKMSHVKGDSSLESVFLELEDKDSAFGKEWDNA